MITCNKLSKKFRSYKKQPGLKGALLSFFKRKYTDKYALKDVSLNISKGEFVGLLGPNGAGKTTLMKMMTGIINPSEGELNVLGHTPHERKIPFRKKIALVMGQKSQLWWDIPAMDSLILLQKYYEIPKNVFEEKLEKLATLLDVKRILHIHVRKLSLGERMKLELISCLLHDPEVIFLDEPTIGLDLVSQKNIRQFLRDYQAQTGCTVVLTSHYMADVEALCERIILVVDGKIAFDGAINKFQNLLGTEKHVSCTFDHAVDTGLEIWQSLSPEWSHENKQVELRVKESDFKNIGAQILKDFPVINFVTEKMPIERVMADLIQKTTAVAKEN